MTKSNKEKPNTSDDQMKSNSDIISNGQFSITFNPGTSKVVPVGEYYEGRFFDVRIKFPNDVSELNEEEQRMYEWQSFQASLNSISSHDTRDNSIANKNRKRIHLIDSSLKYFLRTYNVGENYFLNHILKMLNKYPNGLEPDVDALLRSWIIGRKESLKFDTSSDNQEPVNQTKAFVLHFKVQSGLIEGSIEKKNGVKRVTKKLLLTNGHSEDYEEFSVYYDEYRKIIKDNVQNDITQICCEKIINSKEFEPAIRHQAQSYLFNKLGIYIKIE